MKRISIAKERKVKQELEAFRRKDYPIHETKRGRLYLSKGCLHLKNHYGAGWLYDLIIKHQSLPEMKYYKFQLWTLQQLQDSTWTLYASTGNRKTLHMEFILCSHFPLRFCQLWALDGLLMLASEEVS